MKLMKMTSTMTMSSLEIAELLDVRHDKVKQSIERLSAREVISLPPMGEVKLKRERRFEPVGVYNVCKRDTYVIVAQLSPEFTGRLVDRWLELEAAETERATAKAMDSENRAALRMEYRPMTDALKTTREDIGKETRAHHYSNEADMINRIVTGYPAKKYKAVHEMPDSSLRDLLTPIQKQAMLSLQKANTVYLEEGLSFDERKERLNTLFNRRWNAKLIEECHLMCE